LTKALTGRTTKKNTAIAMITKEMTSFRNVPHRNTLWCTVTLRSEKLCFPRIGPQRGEQLLDERRCHRAERCPDHDADGEVDDVCLAG
jgi:hypothetical protein